MNIRWINIGSQNTGGFEYGNQVRTALRPAFDISLEDLRTSATRFPVLGPIVLLGKLASLRTRRRCDVWIRDNLPSFVLPLEPTSRHVAIIHHVDNSVVPTKRKAMLLATERLSYRNLRRADAIVTVSEYWAKRLRAAGYPRVRVIYNAFDPAEFELTDERVAGFRRRFGLHIKPVVYIGNGHPAAKGAPRAYDALRGLDAHLVTSGYGSACAPVRNLTLDYGDYLCLLKASSVVVTMSQFLEGWCRTAHEAMLCRRPVVGSGLGGMGELLEGGGQVVCAGFAELRVIVQSILQDQARAVALGERGFRFAQQFTCDRLRNAWTHLLEGLADARVGSP